MSLHPIVQIVLLLAGLAAAGGQAGKGPEKEAPLFDDLGRHHHEITTASETAQRYFDQGLILAFGFNHAEAGRSFREAARHDPECAMCWWGQALVLGPNINAPMEPETAREAFEAVSRARALAAGKGTDRERAYIEALARRYPSAEPPQDRKPLDEAFAAAMRELARGHPDDHDAATLLAEALLDLHPWDYWTRQGEARPWTAEILSTLESVLEKAPEHPGAIHFYIHATEASRDAGRAEKYADRLGDLVPGAAHLVHMPSHTYMRIGRYRDAVLVNQKAAKADESYLTQCRMQGIYPLGYVPHNVHVLWYAAAMAGQSAEALRGAKETDHKTMHEKMRDPGMGTLQDYSVTPIYALARFGRWEEILALPAPAEDLRYPTGVWRYARGLALARTGRVAQAEAELRLVREIASRKDLEKVTIWDLFSAARLLEIAGEVLAGEIAAARGQWDEAIARLTEAVRLQDALPYTEPPPFYFPVRHALGAVLMEASRAGQAERVYREDLEEFPENGWSLFGLARSLQAQGRPDEAAAVEARFLKAWAAADLTITASRM